MPNDNSFDVEDENATVAAIRELQELPHDGWLTIQCRGCETIDWFIVKRGNTLHICRNVSEHDSAKDAYAGVTAARRQHEAEVQARREREPEPGPDPVH